MDEPTPYPELNAVLDELIGKVVATIGETFVGAYLQGSFAVGDFDRYSDVDFIVVTDDHLATGDVLALTAVHGEIFRLASPWAQHLEGSYFPLTVLQGHRQPGEQPWYLDHGSEVLVRSDHCNTSVVRWVVREHGIVLAGPPPATLLDPVPVEVLRREISETIRDWGTQILTDPSQYRNRFYQGFIVLSYCRMLHDLFAGCPSSKRVGAEWAKRRLDPEWSRLIDRAWSCRPDPAVSVRESHDQADFEATLRFVASVMETAEVYVSERGADNYRA